MPSIPSIGLNHLVSSLPTSQTTQTHFLKSAHLGPIHGRTYPGLNISYYHIEWYMWTTSPIWCEGTEFSFLEWGEYLPTMSSYLLFNKSSIFDLPSQIACIKTPAITWSLFNLGRCHYTGMHLLDSPYLYNSCIQSQVAKQLKQCRHPCRTQQQYYFSLSNIIWET